MNKITILLLPCLVAASWGWQIRNQHCDFLQTSPFFKEDFTFERTNAKQELIFLTEFSRYMHTKVPSLLQEFAETKRASLDKMRLEKMMREGGSDYFNFRLRRQAPTNAQKDQPDVDYEHQMYEHALPEIDGDEILDREERSASTTMEPEATTTEVPETTTVEVPLETTTTVAEESTEPEDSIAQAIENAGEAIQDVVSIFSEILSSAGQAAGGFLPENLWQDYGCPIIFWPLQEQYCTEARCTACAPTVMAASAVCKKTFGRMEHKCLQEVMGEGYCNYCIESYLE